MGPDIWFASYNRLYLLGSHMTAGYQMPRESHILSGMAIYTLVNSGGMQVIAIEMHLPFADTFR